MSCSSKLVRIWWIVIAMKLHGVYSKLLLACRKNTGSPCRLRSAKWRQLALVLAQQIVQYWPVSTSALIR